MPAPCRAGLPEPDAIVYGSVTLDGKPLTAGDTRYAIEARRSLTGPVVGATTIGAEPAAGDVYVLRLPVESSLPLDNPAASVVGDSLFVVVVDAAAVVAQASLTIKARGEPQQLNIGQLSTDTDSDTLPDAWETAHFGDLTRGPESLGLNGQTLLHNYIAGTNPNDTESAFTVTVSLEGDQLAVGFLRRRAQGAGYEGRTRYYTLQSCLEAGGTWEDVPGYVRLSGDDHVASYVRSADGGPAFYRATVRLE